MKKIVCYLFFCLVLTLLINSAANAEPTQKDDTESWAASQLSPPPFISESDMKDFLSWKEVYEEKNNVRELHEEKGNYLNELVLSNSPYLKQHAKNPINWKPWSQSVLDKAKSENRLIFLSIGYSTCHWCHVMAKESFSDIDVGKVINKEFLAIKVDRELHPQVDDYYTRALEATKGSAGWPITAIIDGDGLPLFIDSYLSKEKLIKLLAKIKNIWDKQPSFLLEIARSIDKTIQDSHNFDHQGPTITDMGVFIHDLNVQLGEQLDPETGGYKGQVKFPSEPMLLYVLDQIRRGKNSQLKSLVKKQLDSMLNSGLYDHVSGGFHRYAIDPDWNIPHFEKMLYNQAQMALVLIEAYEVFHDKKYLWFAKETIDFVLAEMFLNQQGFFSATDADFDGKEGGYYTWTTSEIDSIDNDGLVKPIKVSENEYIVTFESSVFDTIERNKIRKQLNAIRKKKKPIFIDKKILTGWNGLMIHALIKLGHVSDSPKYIDIASSVMTGLWEENYNSKTGALARAKETNNSVSVLEDYSYLTQALIALYDATANKKWLDRSVLLAGHSKNLMGMRLNSIANTGGIKSLHEKAQRFKSYRANDTELVSDLAAAIDVLISYRQRSETDNFKNDREALIRTAKSIVSEAPLSHLSLVKSIQKDSQGESSFYRSLPRGKGSVRLKCSEYFNENCKQVTFDFVLNTGWHLNSNEPIQDYLQATAIASDSKISVTYPNSQLVKLGFQKEPLSLFEGEFSIIVNLDLNRPGFSELVVPIQICSDVVCLLPVKYVFNI